MENRITPVLASAVALIDSGVNTHPELLHRPASDLSRGVQPVLRFPGPSSAARSVRATETHIAGPDRRRWPGFERTSVLHDVSPELRRERRSSTCGYWNANGRKQPTARWIGGPSNPGGSRSKSKYKHPRHQTFRSDEPCTRSYKLDPLCQSGGKRPWQSGNRSRRGGGETTDATSLLSGYGTVPLLPATIPT